MPLHPDLQAILALDAIDEDVASVERKLEQARAVVPNAEAALQAAQSSLEETRATIAATRAEERSLNREIRSYEDRKAGAERALDSGAGSSDAAERQIAQVAAILDDLETRMLLNFERQEALGLEAAAKERAVEAAERALAAARDTAPPEVARLEKELAHHQSLRPAAIEALRRDLRQGYELKRKRKRRAVSFLQRGGCRSCNTMIAAQQLSDLRHGRVLLVCSGCDRWLVTEEPS